MFGGTGRRVVVPLAAAVALTSAAAAQDQQVAHEQMRRIYSSVGAEILECSAYYLASSRLLKTHARLSRASENFHKVSETMLERALIIANLIGQKPESIIIRQEKICADMLKAIGNDAARIDTLLSKYGDHCKEIAANTEARLKYWRDRELARR